MEEPKHEHLQPERVRQATTLHAASGKAENPSVYLALGAAFLGAVVVTLVYAPLSLLLAAVACAAAYYAHRFANPATPWLLASAGGSVVFAVGFLSSRLSLAAQSHRAWTPSGPPPTLDIGVWLWLMPLAGLVAIVTFTVGDLRAHKATRRPQ